ncbi:IS1634 family transposase [Desulfonatronovibrio magnus]|uniref:IS1634 family transposase n=1 Tax=Desulfonatronovibrio magnus TaxID=698827 RepID=UPI0005EB8095|nr:IS1634 family transposase [Desulfonatronovibrio magnus]
MAYLARKVIKGITYYYAEEKERRDGKSRRKWQKYLGTLDKIIKAVEGVPPKPDYAEIFQLGAPAAYLYASQQINMIQTLDAVFSKRNQGPSTGLYLTLAAINRGINAVSKRSMWCWFQDTILLRAFPEANKTSLSSQRFWDNMSTITENKMKEAWTKIIDCVLEQEKIDLSCASYDGTNFYSFIGSFNTRCTIAKRGKNKQGRSDLRQINYALFCSRKDHFPLYFDVFEGNRHDSKEFNVVIDNFFKAFQARIPQRGGMTIVFDKGNNSEENFKKFIQGSGFHFVGSVKPDDHKDLAQISNSDKCFKPLSHPRLDQVKAFRTSKNIYGKKLTVVVTFNNNLYSSQVQSINNEINKALGKLAVIAGKLDDRIAGRVTKGKKPTQASVKSQVSAALSGQHMKKLIKTTIDEHNDMPMLTYSMDTDEFAKLADTYLGKNIIITDNHSWDTEEIVITYRSQYIIEDVFRQMKDRKTGSWWPMYHWTDNMIKTHGFYCSLSLLLRALIMKRAKDSGMSMSINSLHDKLSGIREVINIFPKKKNKQQTQTVVSKLDNIQQRLFDLFDMKQYLSS